MKQTILSLLLALLSITAIAQQNSPDLTTYQWEELKPNGTISGRHECAFIEFEGKLYLLGGRGVLEVAQYDPQTNSWTRRGKTPLEINHFQAVVYNDAIYLVGAMNGAYPVEKPLENVWIYKPHEDRWIKGDKIPKEHQRGGAGSVYYKGKIYIACGIEYGHTSGTTNIFSCYDPKTGQWEMLTKAPHIRDHFPAIVLNDKLYCIGGRNGSLHYPKNFAAFFHATVPEVDVYDFNTQKWITLENPLPTPTAAGGIVAIGNHLIYMGGEGKSSMAYDNTQCLDTETGKWQELAPMAKGLHGSGAVYFDNCIYWAAGSFKQGGSNLKTLLKFRESPK